MGSRNRVDHMRVTLNNAQISKPCTLYRPHLNKTENKYALLFTFYRLRESVITNSIKKYT